jgi:glycosyltransferase involved in cell wall biosynthesis
VPSVVKLHGSDINVIAKLPGPRALSAWALPQAAKIVAVSRALGEEVAALGVPRENIELVMNGVDADLFQPRDRAAARKQLGLADGPLALYVGNLKPEKGVHDLLAAWTKVASGTLAVVGGGAIPITGDRVIAVGPLPHDQVTTWMAACDVLVLASHVEGTPNVVLEALASGRRVVATAVGGIPDLITSPLLGEMVPPRDPDALAAALTRTLATPYDPAQVAALGARGGWAASAAKLRDVLAGTVAAKGIR